MKRPPATTFRSWIGAPCALSVACALLFVPYASAQEQPSEPAKEEPAKEAPAEKKPAPPKALPDLDELLGLPTEKKTDPEAPLVDPEQLELERALESRNVSEMFEQAVQQMSDAAKLLSESRSVGPATQRVQQEIITKLEKLIEEAEKQQSSSSSSSSSSSQQQQQQQQPQQPQPGQNQQANQGDNRDERLPPGVQQAQLNGQIDAMVAAWGALPARVRDALLQGAGDKYSSLYESMTEAYYRRLAEQNTEPR